MIQRMGQEGCSLAEQLVFMYCCSERDPQRAAVLLYQRRILAEIERLYRFKAKITVNGGPKYLLLAPWESHKPKGTADEAANLAAEPDDDDNGGGNIMR